MCTCPLTHGHCGSTQGTKRRPRNGAKNGESAEEKS